MAGLSGEWRLKRRPALDGVLGPLDRDQLQGILLELAEQEEGLAGRIEALARQRPAVVPAEAPARKALPPVDAVGVQQHLHAALRPQRGRGGRYDHYAAVAEAVD